MSSVFKIKLLIGWILWICLSACHTGKLPDAAWLEPGVSRELATFRKEHFGQVRYHLFFSVPEQRDEPLQGKVEILLSLKEPEPLIIDFRGDSGQVQAVSLNGEVVPYVVENEHICLSSDIVKRGENRVVIAFEPDDQSLNRRDEFLYTLLVPDRARTLFPCFDQPDMKAFFTLTLEVPSEWKAVSNSAVVEFDSTAVAGRNRIRFDETEPLSTYLFSFVAGRLSCENFSRNGRNISIYHRETDSLKTAQCPAIAEEVFDALEWLEDFTAIPYPFAKYDLIILPGFQYGGMEHTGATLYADHSMFLDEHPTLNARLRRSSLIAHETAHMWFGDYVTMEWFDDVWTKEVFANYFACRIVEPLYPEVNHRLNFIRAYLPASYSEDRTAGSNPIKQQLDNLRDAGLVYGNIIYDKSPVVMEMLVRTLGQEAFRQGIREYLTTYAYGNATWDGLIHILNKYTEEDLSAWSEVWVHEKGMPELSADVIDGCLTVRQRDNWERGICWPQKITYRILSEKGETEELLVSMSGEEATSRVPLAKVPEGNYTIVPNTDGCSYGFFRIREKDLPGLSALLRTSDDAVLKGSLLITLYENFRQQAIKAADLRKVLLPYLPGEKNALLFSMGLGYLGDCQRMNNAENRAVEQLLWKLVETHPDPSYRLQAFRQYRSLASSSDALQQLFKIWKEKKAPTGCSLSESDYTQLSFILALHFPEKADQIVTDQLARISHPDRQKEYIFLSPSVSPRKVDRDSVFASLKVAENRRVEPWASSSLAYLNHRLRGKESVAYIRPALELLQEVQRTGDIFFPTAWVRALLSGHSSEEARKEVEDFIRTHPDYPPMLMNKISQQSSHLFVPAK